ncbi:nitrate reductase cytochrome c-type subunit [Shimia biformata]|uniref:nitrate reductase cytochrome c-type subunit n=1 Tax=Shimia biformata TaxID=1294299 RepID=UPI0019512E99|nr:nitrate reductase cytochrome c-type subunit [Shimia biformata]
MKKNLIISVITAAAVFSAGLVTAQSASVESLRGGQVDDYVGLQENWQQDKKRFNRNYRQQPPLIPHSIDQYQVDLKANQCLGCHDWSAAGDRNAPTLSMTHYLDREGNQLDRVAGTRWFCTQCHVPQADAPELVENEFDASK